MAKAKAKDQPIQFIVTGRATLSGVSCIVQAKDRVEAISKANAADFLEGIDPESGEIVDWEFDHATPNCE